MYSDLSYPHILVKRIVYNLKNTVHKTSKALNLRLCTVWKRKKSKTEIWYFLPYSYTFYLIFYALFFDERISSRALSMVISVIVSPPRSLAIS